MSHFQQHREFYNRAIMLTPEEQQDPLPVLDNFFTDYKLSEIREMNQNVDTLCLTTDDPPFDDATTRDSIMAYRRSEERLLEAAYLLLKRSIPADTPANPELSKEAHAKSDNAMPILAKGLTEIQVELTNLSTILETASGLHSLSIPSPADVNRELPTDPPAAEFTNPLDQLRKKLLDIQLKLGKMILVTLNL